MKRPRRQQKRSLASEIGNSKHDAIVISHVPRKNSNCHPSICIKKDITYAKKKKKNLVMNEIVPSYLIFINYFWTLTMIPSIKL